MSFRNDRRRRLLGDEPPTTHHREDANGDAEHSGERAGEEPHGKRAYAKEADDALARPLAACIPSSYLMISLLLTAGLGLVAALLVAHTFTMGMTDPAHTVHTRLFDVAAPGNASHWLASMLSAAAAVVAIYIYGLRRHLLHDYHGRYRVWIWTALASLAVSFGEGTSAAASLRALCGRLAALSHLSNDTLWPLVVGGLLALIAVRLGIEVRRSSGALAFLILAATSAALATAASSERLAGLVDAHALLIARGGWLTGYLLGLAMLLSYARHVTGEIEGRIAVPAAVHRRRKKRKLHREVPEEESSQHHHRHKHKHVRTDLDEPEHSTSKSSHSHDRQHTASVPLKSHSHSASRDEDEDEEDERDARDGRPLSRKERRRLRRESQSRAA